MKRLQLLQQIRRNNKLGLKRSPAWEQSTVAKVLTIIGGAIFVLYLIIFGVMFGSMAASSHEPALIISLMPIMLAIDFGMRFMSQHTPAMDFKPYALLPVPRSSVIEQLLLASVVSGYNAIWLGLFLPYFIITLAGGSGFLVALSIFLSGMLLIVANSQLYLLIRTLTSRSLLWWLLPVVVYGGIWSPLLFGKAGEKLFDKILDAISWFGGTPLLPITCLIILIALLWFNRRMQITFVMEEIGKQTTEKAFKVGKTQQFGFLSRFGITGEYLKLEIKSIMRNKTIRQRVITSVVLIVMLSCLVAYTTMYDGIGMLNFWCFYCFALYGVMALTKIMAPEGNYIDLLMVHHENILSLLKAKYYFHCMILIVPLLIMMPAVIEGKFSILMMAAHMFTTSGLLYMLLFVLAIYNKQTLPLNAKLTGKGNVENGIQLIVELVAMFLPISLIMVLIFIFNETVAYTTMAILGLILTALHPLWLRIIYRRMMVRKYENLEGFHASRG